MRRSLKQAGRTVKSSWVFRKLWRYVLIVHGTTKQQQSLTESGQLELVIRRSLLWGTSSRRRIEQNEGVTYVHGVDSRGISMLSL
jgi:hypothetical protein